MKATFVNGGWDVRFSKEWVDEQEPIVLDATQRTHDLIALTKELQGEVADLSTPSAKLVAEKKARIDEIEKLKSEIYQFTNQIADNKENLTQSMKKAREELAGHADSEIQAQQAKLALKVKELRLQTVNPNYMDIFNRVPLRMRRSLLHEEKIDLAADMYEARQHWYWWERTRHFIFFGDTERKITDAERVWEEAQAKLKSRKSRSGVQKWNPFHRAEQDVEQFVGGNVSQIFGFYQFIMINNFIMSNLWTILVIVPFFLDPPELEDALKMDKITGAGFAGLDDKALEYSWFYYGAYKTKVNFLGFEYPMDYAYIGAIIGMFLFQIGVMLSGLFEVLNNRPVDLIIEADEPLDGIEYTALIFCGTNHVVCSGEIQEMNVINLKQYLKEQVEKDGLIVKEQDPSKEAAADLEGPDPWDTIKTTIGRFIGIPLYFSLFQISTQGIRLCYENEAAIAEIFPYGVPVLVTSIRVLVPFVMVPIFLQLERRQEPNLFYHTILRMFLLKMYTMNIILSVVQTLDPVPGNICRVIFIGKVYWRQEMTDLVFSIVMDWGLSMKRKRMSKLPEFDIEELAERIMELLYRQAFIWVSAPYSPMLAYLAIFSTSVLYFFQWLTIAGSYSPPVHGWGRKESESQFRILLLSTAVATFYPTWTFFHTQMNCGPHSTASSPYHYIQEGLQAGPKWLWDLTYYATVPATTMSFIIASLCIQMYFASANQSMQAKVNSALNTYVSEMHDKKQLLRANGIKL